MRARLYGGALITALLNGVVRLGVWIQAYVSDEPMVAFMCNRPAMHSTDEGWVSDDSTNCINDPVDVLNYCRKVRAFPSPPRHTVIYDRRTNNWKNTQ